MEIRKAHNVLESLCAHRASVHAQAAADRAGNSFHPLESAQARVLSRVGDLLQFRADARGDFIAVNVDLVEIAAAWMHDHATNPAVAHEQIRSATDDEERKIFTVAKANDFRESRFIARLDPKLRGTADTQGRVLR